MSSNNSTNQASDEIDLGRVIKLLSDLRNSIFRKILSTYTFIKQNIYWLLGLGMAGVLIGFLLSLILVEQYKLDAIVVPTQNNRDYLEGAVEEVSAKLKSKDTAFFNSLGLEAKDWGGFKVEITPLRSVASRTDQGQTEFLEMLQDFQNTEVISDIVRTELETRTVKDFRITFFFDDIQSGKLMSQAILDYLNTNTYYQELKAVELKNAQSRIIHNDRLIAQIDTILANYARKLASSPVAPETLVLSTAEPMNVQAVLQYKSQLIRDSELIRKSLVIQKDPITLINFGQPHKVSKPFFGKRVVFIPLLLIAVFLFFSFVKYLNRKSDEIL